MIKIDIDYLKSILNKTKEGTYEILDFSSSYIKIKCTVCNDTVSGTLKKVLKDVNCKQCLKNKRKEAYLVRAFNIWGARFDYSNVAYLGTHKPITIDCKVHGEFKINASSHVHPNHPSGCPKCLLNENMDFFKSKIIEIWGDKIDLLNSNFEKITDKIKIKCNTHNVIISTTPTSLLNNNQVCKDCRYIKNYISVMCKIHNCSYDVAEKQFNIYEKFCPVCISIKKPRNTRHTTETFVSKCKINNSHRNYDYSKVIFIKADNKVLVFCPTHNYEFWVKASHLLRGHGCKYCGDDDCKEKLTKNLNQFKKEATEIHGDKYGFDEVNYINSSTKVIIFCKKCQKNFKILPSVLLKGSGCKACGTIIAKQKTTRTLAEFIICAQKIHGVNKFDYTLSEYFGCKKPITIRCILHDMLFTHICADFHLYSNGCPRCNYGNSSKQERDYLDFINVPDCLRKRTLFLKSGKHLFPDAVDFKNKIAWEYNGDFHHGNPKIYSPDFLDKTSKKTMGQKYINTLEKEKKIKEEGYKLITMWEKDWLLICAEFKKIKRLREFWISQLHPSMFNDKYRGNSIELEGKKFVPLAINDGNDDGPFKGLKFYFDFYPSSIWGEIGIYKQDEISPFFHVPYGELNEKISERHNLLYKHGYIPITRWEGDFLLEIEEKKQLKLEYEARNQFNFESSDFDSIFEQNDKKSTSELI